MKKKKVKVSTIFWETEERGGKTLLLPSPPSSPIPASVEEKGRSPKEGTYIIPKTKVAAVLYP